MIDESEIRQWIARLEAEPSSWGNYEKLSVLYTIINQHTPTAEPVAYSAASTPETVGSYGDSEFLQAVSGLDRSRVWAVMDELMDSLKTVNERVYNGVMRKLGA